MTRKFSDHSYQYIQTWLKNKYKTDPEFKKKANNNSSFYHLKYKIQKQTDMIILELLSDLYLTHSFPTGDLSVSHFLLDYETFPTIRMQTTN